MKGATGVAKSIRSGAEGIIYEILQGYQYQKPLESSVRETVSNAVDSQEEKVTALKILRGELLPEAVFVEQFGDEYEDSKWNPDYFEPEWLDETKNHVDITYKMGTGTGYCDEFIIQDYGVGIGDERLKITIDLGGSTKRNRNDQLGAWGLGFKSPLATADYFHVETNHNGRKFKFTCFSKKTDFTVPAFDMVLGQPNEFITLRDKDGTEHQIYYEKTSEKNGTTIRIPAKRMHKDKFLHAVKSQLLYFNDVKLYVETEDGYRSEEHFQAKRLYESSNIMVSDNRMYGRPHILLVRDFGEETHTNVVCYGNIEFLEMDMNQRFGKVGIKCPIRTVVDNADGSQTVLQEGVSVTPSRETVIWNDQTKDFIKKQFDEAANEATAFVNQQLSSEKDLLSWLRKASEVKHSVWNSDAGPLGELSKVIDIDDVELKYQQNNIQVTIRPGFKLQSATGLIFKLWQREWKNGKQRLTGTDMESIYNLGKYPVYMKGVNTSYVKNAYLYEKEAKGPFITIEWYGNNPVEFLKDPSEDAKPERVAAATKAAKYWTVFANSPVAKVYDTVSVPASFASGVEEEEEEALLEDNGIVLTEEEKRQMDKTVSVALFDGSGVAPNHNVKLADVISQADGKETYYCLQEDRDLMKSVVTWLAASSYSDFGKQYNFYVISSKLESYFVGNVMHIKDFFGGVDENGVFTMNDTLRRWYLSEKYKEDFEMVQRLAQIAPLIDQELTKLNQEIYKYLNSLDYNLPYSYRGMSSDLRKDITSFLDQISALQLKMSVEDEVAELNNFEFDVNQIAIIDLDKHHKIQALKAFRDQLGGDVLQSAAGLARVTSGKAHLKTGLSKLIDAYVQQNNIIFEPYDNH